MTIATRNLYASDVLARLATWYPNTTPDLREQAIAPFVFHPDEEENVGPRMMREQDIPAIVVRIEKLRNMEFTERDVWRPCCVI